MSPPQSRREAGGLGRREQRARFIWLAKRLLTGSVADGLLKSVDQKLGSPLYLGAEFRSHHNLPPAPSLLAHVRGQFEPQAWTRGVPGTRPTIDPVAPYGSALRLPGHNQGLTYRPNPWILLATPAGFEPATLRLGI